MLWCELLQEAAITLPFKRDIDNPSPTLKLGLISLDRPCLKLGGRGTTDHRPRQVWARDYGPCLVYDCGPVEVPPCPLSNFYLHDSVSFCYARCRALVVSDMPGTKGFPAGLWGGYFIQCGSCHSTNCRIPAEALPAPNASISAHIPAGIIAERRTILVP